MALTHWKNFDDFIADPWRHHRELLRSSKLFDPWKDDTFRLQPFKFEPWDFKDFELRAREMHERLFSGMTSIIPTMGKNGFEVSVDARQFRPDEIAVKIHGNSVIIEGKHEEKQGETKYISRHFTQRYDLPYGYDADKITSELSSDGYLTVKAPSPKPLVSKERFIAIQQTGEKRGQLVAA